MELKYLEKLQKVNNIEYVERQSLLSFLLALDGWQDYKFKHYFSVSLFSFDR